MAQKVLLYTSDATDSINEISAAGGSVPLQLSDKVLVAILPDELKIEELKYSTDKAPDDLDENTKILIAAWEATADKMSKKNLEDSTEGTHSWDDKGFQYPKNPDNDPELRRQLDKLKTSLIAPAPTSQTLNGKVVVGVLIVSGPSSDKLQFSASEYNTVISEVIEGLLYLSTACYEANVTFIVVPYNINITAVPNNSCNSYESCESVFRDPALVSLGYPPGYDGCVQLVQNLQTQYAATWSYIAFFTKYPMYWFAYQYGVNLYMQYSNDGWGPSQINKVFAHESGHVFGAADEYSSSGCSCSGSGLYNVPNKNCQNCNEYTTKVGCLMNDNQSALCNWSRGQLGWGYWNLPFKTMPSGSSVQSTSASPALAYLNGKMYVAFKANDSSNSIHIGSSADGITWGSFTTVPDQSTSAAPALATFNNKLFLAWKANDSTNKIYYATSADGINWTWPAHANSIPNQSTSASPALAAFNGSIYIAWKANDSSNKIFYGSSTNGTTWASSYSSVSGQSTSAAPALAAFNDKLFLMWKANDSSNKIYFAYSTDGTTWAWPANANSIPNQSTSASPAIAAFKGRLYISWKANSSNNKIYYGSSPDGLTWVQGYQSIDSNSTSAAPAIAALGNTNLIMAMRSNDSNHKLLADNYIPGLF